jgi:hypothetical protein
LGFGVSKLCIILPIFLLKKKKKKKKKKHLEQKKSCIAQEWPLFVFCSTLLFAFSKGLRPDVRLRSLLSAGHSTKPFGFLFCYYCCTLHGVQQ